MPEFHLKEMCEFSHQKLKMIASQLETYLNETTIKSLIEASNDPEEFHEYYKGYLQDLRHLLVNCENAYEKLGISLRRAQFNKAFAEDCLYQVYHLCVNVFFYPRNESYEEDGRHSYTGRDAIIFKKDIDPKLKSLTISLSKMFEELREDLLYYETDYETTKRMKQS